MLSKTAKKLSDVNFPSQIISINADIFRTAPLMQEKLEQDENGMFYWGTAFLGKSCYVRGQKVEDNENHVFDRAPKAPLWQLFIHYTI